MVPIRTLMLVIGVVAVFARPVAGGLFTEHLVSEVRVNLDINGSGVHDIANGHAEIAGSFISDTGITARFDASADTIFNLGVTGVDFAAGSRLEVSGQPDYPQEVSLLYAGKSSALYDFSTDQVSLVGRSVKLAFHGHLDPGDSLHFHSLGIFSQFGHETEVHEWKRNQLGPA
jgi:hypothetical protein